MNKRTLQKHGYRIKHSVAGWWVDGACGYAVTQGYHDSEKKAIDAAAKRIAEAKSSGSSPCWMFDNQGK